MKLYKHQAEAVNEILYLLEMEGKKNIILDAPTSFGKSLVLAETAKQLDGKVIILVNITALIDQIAEHLDLIKTDYSILKAGYDKHFDPKKKIQIVMSQTFYARYENIDFGEVSYVLQDEAHKEWLTQRTTHMLSILKPKGRLGVSGTPYDAAGYALQDVDELISTISIPELEQQGYISPVKYYIPKWSEKIDYDEMRTSGADYSGEAIDELINTDEYAKMVLDSMNHMDAKKKKTLVFCNSIEHAERINNILNLNGYSSYAYHSKNNPDEAQTAIQEFKTGEPLDNGLIGGGDTYIKCICAVSKISIGFSVKDIELGVLCRPTKVLSLARQQIGRLIRTAPNKEYAEILDLAGIVSKHGFHDEPYNPVKRGNRKDLIREKEQLQARMLDSLVKEEPTLVTRSIIIDHIERIERKSSDIPNMTMNELTSLYEDTDNPYIILWIAYDMNRRMYHLPYSINDVKWVLTHWTTFINTFPEYKTRIVRILKTMAKKKVLQNKKLSALHYTPKEPDGWLYTIPPFNGKEETFNYQRTTPTIYINDDNISSIPF